MNDTPADVVAVLSAAYAARTPAERVQMASRMFATATRIATAGIKAGHEGITDTEVRERLLRRLYGSELTSAEVDLIARSIARRHAG